MLNGTGGLNGVGSVSPGAPRFRAGSSRTAFARLYNAHAVDSQAQTIVAQDVAQRPGSRLRIAAFGFMLAALVPPRHLNPLLGHLVGGSQQCFRDGEAEPIYNLDRPVGCGALACS
jgi:hypothetical protein